ncbi:hypothetical protein PV326_005582 [Microctonus aethiopoides]|nr:hypothetical protein PV326_005582 [Microctonus aethiopoides]
MDIGVNITKDLSPKKIKFLPPYNQNYDAVLEENFGNKARPEAYQLRRDSIEFHDSVMQIRRVREEREMKEYNCKMITPRSEGLRSFISASSLKCRGVGKLDSARPHSKVSD